MQRNSKERTAPKNLYKRQLASGWTWYARLTLPKDGVMVRQAINLHTQSLAVARKKVAQLQNAPEESSPAEETERPETVAEAIERLLDKAKREGLKTWKGRKQMLQRHALPIIGEMYVTQVRRQDVRLVLETARDNGLARQTITHLRNALSRIFADLLEDEEIHLNPATGVRIPAGAKVQQKERVQLNDAELGLVLNYLDGLPDEARIIGTPVRELQTMITAARYIGGMRTSDLHAWQWGDIDVAEWKNCRVRRPKTKGHHKELSDVAHPLTPGIRRILKRWWKHEGSPKVSYDRQGRPKWKFEDGRTITEPPLVFPCRNGPRAGKQKLNTAYSAELRQALRQALGFQPKELTTTKVRSNGRPMTVNRIEWVLERATTARERALLEETETTLPVDFHGLRHAYCTDLAAKGVTLQEQMALAGHTQTQTAMRYVQLGQSSLRPETLAGLPDAPLPSLRVVGT